MNYELNKLIGNADTVRFIKSRRIAWLGHVMRMDDKRTPKRILQWKPILLCIWETDKIKSINLLAPEIYI